MLKSVIVKVLPRVACVGHSDVVTGWAELPGGSGRPELLFLARVTGEKVSPGGRPAGRTERALRVVKSEGQTSQFAGGS